MKSPFGVEIYVGQHWKEVDPRFDRTVCVAEIDSDAQKIRITSDYTRFGWAKLSRFNGKRGGYSPIEVRP